MRKILQILAMSMASFIWATSSHAETTVDKKVRYDLLGASYDGKWAGTVKCLYDPGLWPDDECDVGFSFEIKGDSFLVEQSVRTKKGETTKTLVGPGKFHFSTLLTNATASYIDSGDDEDGTWVETWSFVMTLKDKDHMIVHWTRVVNNMNMPVEKKGSKFSSVGMGELTRVVESAIKEGTLDSAEKLVKDAQLDFVVFDALKSSMLMNSGGGQAREEMEECLSSNGYGEFAPILAEHIAKNMTEDEINEQLDFYRTPLGKKSVKAVLALMHRDHHIDQDEKIPDISDDEMRKIQMFMHSTSSWKLGAVLKSSYTQSGLRDAGMKMINHCKK